jgi:alkaline phosphatase D
MVGATSLSAEPRTMTHGPMLGRPTATSMDVWARTSVPAEFEVRYGSSLRDLTSTSSATMTLWDHDCTGVVKLTDLASNTRYAYQVYVDGFPQGQPGTFKTLPSSQECRHPRYNPKGLFNFRFEVGCCANQNPENGIGHSLPLYQTMNERIAKDMDFAIMNGDWLYEEVRETPPIAWLTHHGLTEDEAPKTVKAMPNIVGVWENYRLYLSRGVPLSQWHRNVPSYFTFDDHELVNDIWGAGTAGRRHRRSVFRDIGTQAWYDYLGWANPVAFEQKIQFGRAKVKAGSDQLIDLNADFRNFFLDEASNLHIHWGTSTAGVNDMKFDDDSGDPNSMVYDIVKVVDKNTVQISPPATADGVVAYSIGRRNYGSFRVANCEYFLLDTRSHRQMHDTSQPSKPGLTMLGDHQRNWLIESMKSSDADFFFVVSSVPMMVPHSGAGGFEFDAKNKEEAWVAFLDERDKLIQFWDELGKPVFVMTGDLHNSFSIKVTDHVWEFCCGPHNSVNHVPQLDEGDRPITGKYLSGMKECDIRWSSYILPDVPRLDRCYPYYCVVQVNNVFNMPPKIGGSRLVSYPHPQVIFQYFDGRTGELAYSETVTTKH